MNCKLTLSKKIERNIFLRGEQVSAYESSRYRWARNHMLGKKILEISCSSGFGRQFFSSEIEYTGLDFSSEIIDIANQQNWGGNFYQVDLKNFVVEEYDTIIAFDLLECLNNKIEFIQILKRQCKRLLISCPRDDTAELNENFTIEELPSHYGTYNPEVALCSWSRDSILCSIATKGRYFSTLPLVVQAIANQTRKPNKIIIFDDNDEIVDVRQDFLYQHLFWMLHSKGIELQWIFAEKKGQHFIHQMANSMGFDWVWRCDDDAIPEPNVLENLSKYIGDDIGAIGGSVLEPPATPDYLISTGNIQNINNEPNLQWGLVNEVRSVQHLYSTFLYKSGVHAFNLDLSRIAHREETLFTFGLYLKGYKLLVVPNAVSWHLKNPYGGIRDAQTEEMVKHDELIFLEFIKSTSSQS